jgi:DNA-binding transcriptional LysR family regulator
MAENRRSPVKPLSAPASGTESTSSEMPPIALLRAFDAAGRHRSFKQAAAYLHVTPSTISHQIADLESYFGVQLFLRLPRGLKLTAEGSALLEDVSAAFVRLRDATTRLRARGQPMLIRVSANPFVASEVLLPLLESFEQAFPGRSLHVSATEELEDPRDGTIDFCVRFGDGSWPGLEIHPLCPLSAIPVVASSVTDPAPACVDYPFRAVSAWEGWRLRGGAAVAMGQQVRSFNSYGAAMRAVELGLGVSLALWPVVQPWIAGGRVRRFSDASLPLDNLWLLSRPLSPAQSTLLGVRDWLIQALNDAVR